MKQYIKIIFALVCFASFSAISYAANITGTVVDQSKEPLTQASLRLLSAKDSTYLTGTVADENGNFTKPVNFRKRFYRVLKASGIEIKGLHSLRHTFATNLVNGIKQPDGTIKSLTPRQVADLLGHSTSEITERYYVKKDIARLQGITDTFNL